MPTTIQYNGVNPFQGIAPTPFVSRTESMVQVGERLLMQENFVFHGTITGSCHQNNSGQYENLVNNLQLNLVNNFATDYQTLQILDDSTNVLTRNLVKVQSINFPSNNYGAYSTFLPFEISLQCYPDGYGQRFSGYHVLNPVHEVVYQQGDNGIMTVDITTSAKGLNTSSSGNNAFANAVAWVENFKGWRPTSLQAPFQNVSVQCLRTVSETENRFNGTYEIKESYAADLFESGDGILRYTTSSSYNEDNGVTTIEINGSIEGCKALLGDAGAISSSMSSIRARYNSFDAYSKAVYALIAFNGQYGLNPNPVSKSVAEDTDVARISFAFTFNDDLRTPHSFDYKVSFSYDYENDIVSATLDGEITSRTPLNQFAVQSGYNQNNKWVELASYAQQINLFTVIQSEYTNFIVNTLGLSYADYPLISIPTSTSRTDDYYNFRISLNATYRSSPVLLPPNFQKFDYTLQFTPALEQYKEFPCLDGQGTYQLFDLGYKTRAQMAIQVSAEGTDGLTNDAVLSNLKQQINTISAQVFPGSRKILDSQQLTTTSEEYNRSVSGSASYSAEQAVFLINGVSASGGGSSVGVAL